MLKKTEIPESCREEFLAQRTRLVKSRVSLLGLAGLAIYFSASLFLILIRPQEFKMEEIPAWGFLILGTGTVLYFNRLARTLPRSKLNAYGLAALFLFVFVKLALIYPEAIGYTSIYFVLALFFVSLVIPWTAVDVVLLSLLDVTAYSAFFAFRTGLLTGQVPTAGSLSQYVDGIILITVAFVMCLVIRRRETARDIENFVLLKEVEEKNEQIRKELELARRIHKTLIPDSIQTGKADITVSYLPVHYMGGDYAKFHFLGEDRLIFIIADVTGHGIPAALLVNRLHAEFERLAKEVREPGVLLKELDQFIVEDFQGTHMYLTAFCGLLDFRDNRFLYSNYGHPPQYIYHATRNEIRRLPSQTTLLGVPFQESRVYQTEIPFGRGDRILLFTDGILESGASGENVFGAPELEEFIKNDYQLSHIEFNQRLLDELNRRKKGEFKDDIFLLSIKIH